MKIFIHTTQNTQQYYLIVVVVAITHVLYDACTSHSSIHNVPTIPDLHVKVIGRKTSMIRNLELHFLRGGLYQTFL